VFGYGDENTYNFLVRGFVKKERRVVIQSDSVEPIIVDDELTECPQCGYGDGFHVGFARISPGGSKDLRIWLICPKCSARYDLGKYI
jgi:hypothetical protein